MSQEDFNNANVKEADAIIKKFVGFTSVAGLIPIPVADFFAISALQMEMIRRLCRVYGVSFRDKEIKAAILALTSTSVARIGSRMLAKTIPVIGSIVGGVATAAFSGAATYALGEVFKRHFESGGSFIDFNWNDFKRYYNEKFEKGKEYTERLKDEAKVDLSEAKEALNEAANELKSSKAKVVKTITDAANEVVKDVSDKLSSITDSNSKSKPKTDLKKKIKNIQELFDMKESGAITNEEYERMKESFINEE